MQTFHIILMQPAHNQLRFLHISLTSMMDKNSKPFPWHDVASKEFFYESHFYFSMFLSLVNTQPIKAHNVFVGS